MRALIVNADDFGRSPGINMGVIRAHEQGIVTSAGLMVRWPAAAEAVAYARSNPQLSLGLHLDLGEWIHDNGGWRTVYETASSDDVADIEHEIHAQIEAFRTMVGADPTHLDTHQHQHRHDGPSATILRHLTVELGIPVRHFSDEIRYCGSFYGQTAKGEPLHDAISAENLISLGCGSCHPALRSSAATRRSETTAGRITTGERELEVEALCDPRVSAVIADEGVELRTFTNI